MKNKPQIFFIHGGMTFKTRKHYLHFLKTRTINIKDEPRWYNEYLDLKLGKTFEIIRPRMPLKEYAKYEDWKIHFEKHIPYLRNNLILIGGSLGGIFLVKYLSENKFHKKIRSLYLVCPPYDNTLNAEVLAGGFKLKNDLSLLEREVKDIHFFFSKDDNIVPISHAEKYRARLKTAHITIFKRKNGHFRISTFPELVRLIIENSRITSLFPESTTPKR